MFEIGRAFPPLRFLNVPNLVTTLAAASGLVAAYAALLEAPRVALTSLVGAVVCDRLDGVLARRLGQTTEIGRELDSLADAIGFGVAPSVIAFAGGFRSPLELVALVLYVLSAIWRLAHYNLTGLAGSGPEERFTGVPTTVAASAFIIIDAGAGYLAAPLPVRHGVLLGFFLGASLLMVSALPFKKNGLVVKSLYVLLPLALLAVWTGT